MIFEVVVMDSKSNYIYSFLLKEKSISKALFFVDSQKDSLYVAASDEGIVNLRSNFIEDNPTFQVQRVNRIIQKADVIIGSKKFLIKNNKLRAI